MARGSEQTTAAERRSVSANDPVNSDRVLIIWQHEAGGRETAVMLERAGFKTQVASNDQHAIALLEQDPYRIVLCDLELEGQSSFPLLRRLKDIDPAITIVVTTDSRDPASALEAIRQGADDVVAGTRDAAELILAIRKAQERERLKVENDILRNQITKRYSFANIVANSAAMLEIFDTIKKIADYKTTVMIYGESGTGKELVARAIHYNSARKNRRFIAINCGAIPENLLESELFGHRKGSFTDAVRDKKGLFEEAQGGTIFLDEIGELPLHLQVKLLRVLQENEIRPIGEAHPRPIDVRILAATLRDLDHDVLNGRFRDDLFYRLNVISVHIPPLRERRDDIPLLVNFFLKKHQEKLGLPVYGISRDALAVLMEHDWPGNIRELENCIERAMILTDGDQITVASLPKTVHSAPAETTVPAPHLDSLSIKAHTRAVEENLIRRALEKTHGNRTHAARLLEISHRTLLYKLKEYRLADAGSSAPER